MTETWSKLQFKEQHDSVQIQKAFHKSDNQVIQNKQIIWQIQGGETKIQNPEIMSRDQRS